MFNLVISISCCCISLCTLCRLIVGLVLLVAWVVEGSLLFGFVCFVIGLEYPLSVSINSIIRHSTKKDKCYVYMFKWKKKRIRTPKDNTEVSEGRGSVGGCRVRWQCIIVCYVCERVCENDRNILFLFCYRSLKKMSA